MSCRSQILSCGIFLSLPMTFFSLLDLDRNLYTDIHRRYRSLSLYSFIDLWAAYIDLKERANAPDKALAINRWKTEINVNL
jgi:hypothetical protein